MSALSYVRTASATSPLALIAVALSPSAMERFPRPSAWFGFTARHRSYASIAPVTSPVLFYDAHVAVRLGVVRVDLYRPRVALQRLVVASQLGHHHAEVVKRGGVPRVHARGFPVMRHGLRGRAEHLDPGAQIGERRGQPLARGWVPRVGAKRSSERVRGFGEHPVRLKQRPESPARQRVVRHAGGEIVPRCTASCRAPRLGSTDPASRWRRGYPARGRARRRWPRALPGRGRPSGASRRRARAWRLPRRLPASAEAAEASAGASSPAASTPRRVGRATRRRDASRGGTR